MKNYYEVLGIEKTADALEIKRAYFRLVRQYPPERFPEEFKELRAAYDTLSDEEERARYDDTVALPADAAYLFQQAQKAERQGRYTHATEIYQSILKQYPDLNSIRADCARSLESEGKNGKAITIWEQLCEREPDNAEYALELADSYHHRGWRKKALRAYKRALEIDSGNVDAWVSLLYTHFEAKEIDEAKAVCLQALAAVEKKGKESTRLYTYAIILHLNEDIAVVEGYFRNIVRLMRSTPPDSHEDLETAITLLLNGIMAAGHTSLLPYVQEMAATLPHIPEALLEQLAEARAILDLEALEDSGFSDLFNDLFLVLQDDCDCADCRNEKLALEFHILADMDTYRPQLLRLKEEYPHLFALHAAFFHEALRTRQPQKMMYQRMKALAKSGLQPSPLSGANEVPDAQQPVRRSETKVGRNDPCPCGSGKKYKKCCGA